MTLFYVYIRGGSLAAAGAPRRPGRRRHPRRPRPQRRRPQPGRESRKREEHVRDRAGALALAHEIVRDRTGSLALAHELALVLEHDRQPHRPGCPGYPGRPPSPSLSRPPSPLAVPWARSQRLQQGRASRARGEHIPGGTTAWPPASPRHPGRRPSLSSPAADASPAARTRVAGELAPSASLRRGKRIVASVPATPIACAVPATHPRRRAAKTHRAEGTRPRPQPQTRPLPRPRPRACPPASSPRGRLRPRRRSSGRRAPGTERATRRLIRPPALRLLPRGRAGGSPL